MEFTRGDLLEANTEALVNTVNCVGHMGRGIAAQFKRAYPDNFKAYASACKRDEVAPGKMFVFELGSVTYPRYIVNFPTKRHWRAKSSMKDIRAGLTALAAEIKERGITSIAIPPLGCGLGGLDWDTVRPLIEHTFSTMPEVRVVIFEPHETSSSVTMKATNKAPKMTPGRAVLIGLFERYMGALMDPELSLLELHKLMYFAQAAGEPLRLKYVKGHYGPYAENLRHVLSALDGHMITGYGDGGDTPHKPLMMMPGIAETARAFLADHPDTYERFERVSTLVEGFETSFGMELLATVHWVMTQENVSEGQDILDAIHKWSARKRRMFSAHQVQLAAHRLMSLGWLTQDSNVV